MIPDVGLRQEGIIIRVPYRSANRIPPESADLASTISRAARGLGLTPILH